MAIVERIEKNRRFIDPRQKDKSEVNDGLVMEDIATRPEPHQYVTVDKNRHFDEIYRPVERRDEQKKEEQTQQPVTYFHRNEEDETNMSKFMTIL